MDRFKEFLYKFMNGRYGIDELYKFTMWSIVACIILNLFFRSLVLNLIEMFLLVAMIYRCFSKNFYRRQQENTKYLELRDEFTTNTKMAKNAWRYRKTHIFRSCPSCKAVIKLPRKKGTHVCRYPRCGQDFSVHCH